MQFTEEHVRTGSYTVIMLHVLLTCGKHMHDPIISLIVEVWPHKVSLILPHVIEVPVSNKTSE